LIEPLLVRLVQAHSEASKGELLVHVTSDPRSRKIQKETKRERMRERERKRVREREREKERERT